MLQINELIKNAMLNHESDKVEVYRAIKTEFLNAEKAKNAKEMTETSQFAILNKMVKDRQEVSVTYMAHGRMDLAEKECAEARIISALLPTPASEEEIREFVENWISANKTFTKKDMGTCIKETKAALKNVDGKQLSTIVQSYL